MSEVAAPDDVNPNGIGVISDLDQRSVLQQLKTEIAYGLNCHQVGIIVAFDATVPQAQVQIMMQRVVFNRQQTTSGQLQLTPNIVNYPILVNCPVFCPMGNGFLLTMPVAVGDPCLLLFNDRDIDNWFSTNSMLPPNTSRAHDLSDGFALVGFRNLQTKVANYSTTASELRSADNTAKVSIAQGISILTNGTEVKINVGTTAIDIDSSSGKVGISNASTSLKTVLDNLISALTGWVDTGGQTPNPATVTALNAVKTTSDSLLK